MKNLKPFLFLCTAFFSLQVCASDTFKIKQVFVTTDGRFAIEAETIPVNINAKQSCHQDAWAKKWLGVNVNEGTKTLISTLLSAQARGATVTVSVDGCLGAWHKITALYSR